CSTPKPLRRRRHSFIGATKRIVQGRLRKKKCPFPPWDRAFVELAAAMWRIALDFWPFNVAVCVKENPG
ncbi:hypothetical protein, partial [Burkholderia ubonensis]|uniref:hypothetical protein n=1 Tax=Burkholderia ubonensis TaxID=101571 RepID=UPI001E64CC4C